MKIKVKKSKIHNKGVFAKKNIRKNEVIEICNLIILNQKDTEIINKTSLYDYYFSWNDKGSGIALGNGSLYNHSYEPNAKYEKNFITNTLRIVALKSITAGSEITVNYNGNPKQKNKVWFDK